MANTANEIVCYEDSHSPSVPTGIIKEYLETHPLTEEAPPTAEPLKDRECRPDFGDSSVTKVVLARLPLIKLLFVLILTLAFAVVLLVASHLTHSLTLRVEAYHALYNMMALAGCLFTMKICERPTSIKNTFGWARVELLSCLCTLLFIASLCFSVSMESIQTAAHAGHQDPMHHPIPVIALGGIGLCVNAIVFCLIGGYTHHQGCFLERRNSGVWIQSVVSEEAIQAGLRTLLSHPFKQSGDGPLQRSYQGLRGILRDISGLIVVMLCAAIVLWDTRETLALYVDPAFAVLSASILLFLSFPFGKECCQILLQTIPGNIDVHTFSTKLLQEFPEVVNIHHLHIWSLTPGKVIATAHVVYSNPKVYRRTIAALEQYFHNNEITQVTLQPEFVHYASNLPSEVGSNGCLLQCANNLCRTKECCEGCSKGQKGDETPPVRASSPTHHSCEGSCEISIYGEHHGTSAYRSSAVDIYSTTFMLQKSISKDDISRLDKNIQPKMLRSLSCTLQTSEKATVAFQSSVRQKPLHPK